MEPKDTSLFLCPQELADNLEGHSVDICLSEYWPNPANDY